MTTGRLVQPEQARSVSQKEFVAALASGAGVRSRESLAERPAIVSSHSTFTKELP